MIRKILFSTLIVFVFVIAASLPAMAEDERAGIKADSIPQTGSKSADFVPKGWKIEEEIKGDLNDDKIADRAIKLVEDKPADGDKIVDRGRASVLLFADKDGGLRKAAVTDKLLQCTACGGAFYGVVDAPANVSIEKGVLVVNQDHGSREVTETTYRFRFDEQPNMFILIGFDYKSDDRNTGGVATESTNYLTGKRITTTSKGKRAISKTTIVKKMRYSIEEVDAEKWDGDATHRLHLD